MVLIGEFSVTSHWIFPNGELVHMKRDLDFIRELLLKIENGQTSFNCLDTDTAAVLRRPPAEGGSTKEEAEKLTEHLDLLKQAGFIEIMLRSGSGHYVTRLTWEGHDFLDSIRNPKIWEKTKKSVEGAGGFTIDLLKDLAKGFVKKQIEEYTGIKL